jgi:membrane-associated phospholipid phosphatase
VCAAVFLVMLGLAYWSDGARSLDAKALDGFLGLQRPAVDGLTHRLGSIGDPGPVAAIGLLLAGLAVARGRPRHALFVVVLIASTSVSSQVLKALLAYPRYEGTVNGAHIAPAAFPSGHSTAAMTLAIAIVVVSPARMRPAAALLGTILALGVSFSVVAMGWHFPSDAIGGYLLATGEALVLLAGLRWAEARYPERTGRSALAQRSGRVADAVAAAGLAAGLGVALFGLAAVTAAVVLFRLSDLIDYAQEHTGFVAVAAALALSATVLLAGLAGALTRRG